MCYCCAPSSNEMTVQLPFILMHEIENFWSIPLLQETQQDRLELCRRKPNKKTVLDNYRKPVGSEVYQQLSNGIGPRNCFINYSLSNLKPNVFKTVNEENIANVYSVESVP